MSTKEERLQILEMIEGGVISASDGARLLQALADESPAESSLDLTTPLEAIPEPLPSQAVAAESAAPAPTSPAETDGSAGAGQPETLSGEPPPAPGETEPHPASFDPNLNKWRNFWTIPLWVGVGITVVGALLMYLALQSSGTGFWFGCAWLPFLLGLGVIVLAWWSRQARWLHVRVHQKPGERPQTIAISLPLPLRLMAWFVRTFRSRIPSVGNAKIDEVILALGETTGPQTPFYVEVDEGDDGEKVQVYIG